MPKKHYVAIVTGAAQGIGKAIAQSLMADGVFVVLTDINEDELSKAMTDLKPCGECISFILDVSEVGAVNTFVRGIATEYGHIDILVNNAGIAAFASLEETNDETLDRILNINFKGTFFMCRAVAPYMKAQKSGKIMNVSSITSKRGDNTTSPCYGSSKGAVNVLTKSLAKEFGPYGINVNAVAPHAIDTPIMKLWTEEKRQEAGKNLPIGRIGTPEDVAEVVKFLVSDKASYITGQILNVDGGHFMDS